MGLYCSFDVVSDFGYIEATPQYGIVPDYSMGCQIFVDTFLSVAKSLVPVDTGFLQSTIDAGSSGTSCYCEASAEYAQYVEYGTWKMEAQPYFEPAIEEALGAAQFYWDEAQQEAEAEEHDQAINDETLEIEEEKESMIEEYEGKLMEIESEIQDILQEMDQLEVAISQKLEEANGLEQDINDVIAQIEELETEIIFCEDREEAEELMQQLLDLIDQLMLLQAQLEETIIEAEELNSQYELLYEEYLLMCDLYEETEFIKESTTMEYNSWILSLIAQLIVAAAVVVVEEAFGGGDSGGDSLQISDMLLTGMIYLPTVLLT